MRKISSIFLCIALFCLFFADLEISSLRPGAELSRLLIGALSPDFSVVFEFHRAFINTIVFALCAMALALFNGSLLALIFHWPLVRYTCAFIRSIHEIFWVFLLMPLIGINSICGILALAIPYSAIFAKVFSEILQETEQKASRGLPIKSHRSARFLYFVLPTIWQQAKHYTSYRFECALRSSAVLGFIGLPTLGFHLETAFREGMYSEASAILYLFFLMVGTAKYWMRAKWSLLYVTVAITLVSKQINWSMENFSRFFSYDILPWPIRSVGVADGSFETHFQPMEVLQWLNTTLSTEVIPGVVQTLILSQIALVGSAIVGLLLLPWITKHFANKLIKSLSNTVLVVLRTMPDYMIAYILILLLGPSMLPAVIAISIHNGAILAQLMRNKTDSLKLPTDTSAKSLNSYLFIIVPQIFGQFLAFLFYRWEVIMRDSAILGLLGIYTLGFYIDSAIAEDKMDTAIIIILAMALLNIFIDSLSQSIRARGKYTHLALSNSMQ